MGQKVIFLYGNRDFCQPSISLACPGLKLSHSDHPKKNSVSEQWVIFWGPPLFLAVAGLCHDRGISTLNVGPFSTKLGGTVRAIKKMTQNDNGPSLARITEKRAFLRSAEKCFFGQKWVFYPKKSPKIF